MVTKLNTVFILVTILLNSCSQTTVHLYARYLSEQQIKDIDGALTEKNFAIKTNQLMFPESITQSSITYSPMINDRDAVNKVVHSMSALGWSIYSSDMLVANNHWYKGNSIALMLIPPEISTLPHKKNWAFEYKSQGCDLEMTINLDPTGSYQIRRDNNVLLDHALTQGQWDINQYPFIELTSKQADWPLYFELKSYYQEDKIGKINIYELSPLDKYPLFSNCTFTFGIRQ